MNHIRVIECHTASQITKNIYIGSNATGENKKFLELANINNILICAADLEPRFPSYIIV